MANICIICSSPGDYNIFAPIPAYLHESTNEFLLWPKDISKMLEETTGLIITTDDVLLPRKICALCVSYLKHAATFRQQAIDNILNLKAAQLIKNPDKHSVINDNSIIVREDRLNFSQTRCSDLKNILASKPKTNKCDEYMKKNFENSPNMQKETVEQSSSSVVDNNNVAHRNNNKNIASSTYLNLLFDKDSNKTANNRRKHFYYQMNRYKTTNEFNDDMNPLDLDLDDIFSGSSDDNDIVDYKNPNFFNYKQKNFEEDDILNDIYNIKDTNIIINFPEIHKERKCPACSKRFMFEDSYKEHTEICVEYQLLSLIEEVNRLLIIRRKKTISPHEFVRRMIFSLKKIADWLTSHGENINIPSQSDIKKSIKKNSKKQENENNSIVEQFNSLNSTVIENPKFHSTGISDGKKLESIKNHILNNSNYEIKLKTSTPDTKNNIRKPSDNTFQTIQQKADKKSADDAVSSSLSALCTPSPPVNQKINQTHKNQKNGQFNTVLLTPVGHLTSAANFVGSPSPKLINFSARCSVCNIALETIASLEDHNAKFHNYQPVEKEEHKKIIALFDEEE